MKKTIFFLLFSMTLFAQAPTSFQYGVRTPTLFPWNGTNKIDVNGRLKLNTTAGGLIPPQLTTTQRLAIASPETGESVYDVTLGKYYHWDGSGWVASAGGAVATDDLEATLTAGNSANNDFNLIGPSGAITNYAGGYLQAQDISGDVTTRIGLTTEATGATNFYLNLIETGSNAKTNAASLGLASEYFSNYKPCLRPFLISRMTYFSRVVNNNIIHINHFCFYTKWQCEG